MESSSPKVSAFNSAPTIAFDLPNSYSLFKPLKSDSVSNRTELPAQEQHKTANAPINNLFFILAKFDN